MPSTNDSDDCGMTQPNCKFFSLFRSYYTNLLIYLVLQLRHAIQEWRDGERWITRLKHRYTSFGPMVSIFFFFFHFYYTNMFIWFFFFSSTTMIHHLQTMGRQMVRSGPNMRRTHDGDDDRRMGGETGDEEMRRTTRKRPKRCGRLLGYRMSFLFVYFLLTHF